MTAPGEPTETVDPLAALLGIDDGLGPGAVPAAVDPPLGHDATIKAAANPQAADLKSPW